MKNHSAFVPIGLVLSVFALSTCASGRDVLFDEDDDSSDTTGGQLVGGAGGQGVSSSVASSSASGIVFTTGPTTGAGGAGGDGGAGGTPISVDCENLPKGPLPYKVLTGHKASEDMDFDHLGNVVGAENGNIFQTPFSGQSQLWVPGSGDFIAGLRFTSKGVLIYANVSQNSLFKIVAPATKTFLIGGLAYPNGMDADNSGRITVAEQSSSQVRRVDPDTGESEILGTGLNNANGVSYSPDYKTVYVGSFGGGTIYKITLDAQDKPISQGVHIQGFTPTGSFDGMGVDACGNVYVCEYGPAKVWRVSKDGTNPEVVVDLGGETGWIPNMQWGSGIGGWDPMVLYVRDISSGKMYEVPVGVPSKPRKYP